jgi:hypothetical protein
MSSSISLIRKNIAVIDFESDKMQT